MESILKQTIEPNKVEIIVVDDASTDRSVEILKKYEQENSERMILVLNEENSLKTKKDGRNIALEYANGDYIMYLDQDDYYNLNAFEILHNLMDENPELDYIEYDFEPVYDEQEVRSGALIGEGLYKFSINSEEDRICLCREDILPGATFVWTKIYRKSFLERKDIRQNDGERMSGYSDNFFWGLTVTNCKNFGKLCEKLYFYRMYDGSYSGLGQWNDIKQFERCKTGIYFFEECEKRGMKLQENEVAEYIFLFIFLKKTFDRFLFTFNPIPYNIFAFMQEEIKKRCPNCKNNSILKSNVKLYRIVKLLDYDWTPAFLESLKKELIEESEKE